jgi:hypothetical protein
MTLEEIRSIIRASLKIKILEEQRKLQRIPKDFDDFSRIFRRALMKTGAYVMHERLDAHFFPCGLFEIIYEAWSNIELELRGLDDLKELTAAWNEALEFYMPSILEELDLDQKVILEMKR